MVELIWRDPSDLLAHDFYSVVNTFNGVESFGKALGDRAVKHEVSVELAACLQVFLFYFKSKMLWELSEQ